MRADGAAKRMKYLLPSYMRASEGVWRGNREPGDFPPPSPLAWPRLPFPPVLCTSVSGDLSSLQRSPGLLLGCYPRHPLTRRQRPLAQVERCFPLRLPAQPVMRFRAHILLSFGLVTHSLSREDEGYLTCMLTVLIAFPPFPAMCLEEQTRLPTIPWKK